MVQKHWPLGLVCLLSATKILYDHRKIIVGHFASTSAILHNKNSPFRQGTIQTNKTSLQVNAPNTTFFEAFNITNPNPSWCPNATCYNCPVCLPCQRRFLIEIATGRSGSTSLKHMLNMLPGVRMSGENYDALGRFNKMIVPIIEKVRLKSKFAGAWYHEEINRGDLACPAQRLIEALNPPSKEKQNMYDFDDSETIVGFKTIRFLDRWKNDGDAVRFVKENFPCSRIVINIRSNNTAQVVSYVGNPWFDEKNISERLLEMNSRLRNVAALFGPDQAYWMDSSEWTGPGGVSKMNQLIQWLGFQRCTFEKLIHDNKNYSFRVDRTELDLGSDCRMATAV